MTRSCTVIVGGANKGLQTETSTWKINQLLSCVKMLNGANKHG